MTADSGGGEEYRVTVHGGVSGQLAAGKNITQRSERVGGGRVVTEADRDELRRLFVELRDRVAAEASADRRDSALERVDELEEAVVEGEPDVTTMAYVRSWFAKHLPALAGAVTALVVNPLVGKVVEAAGDLVAGEFRRRFGGEDGSGRAAPR